MKNTTMYSKPNCPYCIAAKRLLSARGFPFTEYNIAQDPEKFAEMLALSPLRTVPQIVIDDHHIGGYTDLVQYFADGQIA